MINATKMPKRIVLSRKGFDSSFGGCASPIIDGRLISLPIPEVDPKKGRLRYRKLRGNQGKEIVDLINQLTTRRNVERDALVHLDPDIRPELRDQNNRKLPLTFGQSGTAQAALKGLKDGDLFLFFGWFRQVEQSSNGVYQFKRDEPDIHAIWGWLQVDKILDLQRQEDRDEAKQIARHHPHVTHHEGRKNNFLYVARDRLAILPRLLGAGVFSNFGDELQLTGKQSKSRSDWSLPGFFREIDVKWLKTMDKSRWKKVKGDRIEGRCPGRGQEFVFSTDKHKAEIAGWLAEIFKGELRQAR